MWLLAGWARRVMIVNVDIDTTLEEEEKPD
jgi:hypothetical protein